MSIAASLRQHLTAQRLAQLAVVVEMVVIARVIGEIYRLRAENGDGFTLDAAMVWLAAALIALGFLAVSVLCYFAGRNRLAGFTAVAMVAVLIVYKAMFIGLG
jgi:hypothetical protein